MTESGLLDREALVELLYAAESTGTDPDLTALDGRTGRVGRGLWEHLDEVDAVIAEHASGWRIERMPAVDRNILRVGTYELLHTSTPVGAVISEAVELAKRFSTAKSGAFVNGVLDSIARACEHP